MRSSKTLRVTLGLAVLVLAACGGLLSTACQAEEFPVRGIKGLWWDGMENYRLALPWLAEHRLNFLMFCYTSFPASAKDWRGPYSREELDAFGQMSAQAKKLDVDLCLSFNPAIWSNPPLGHSSEQDYQRILEKVTLVHARGINWFALCLDDINRELTPADRQRFGTLESAQVYLVSRLWSDMQRMRPEPKLIFCPSAYTTRDMLAHQDYIKAIGAGIPKDVRIFWTGPEVCSPTISKADADMVAQWLRRKPFVWDNYPVNDMYPWRPLVAPVRGRAADLGGAVSGFMANPMKQFHASTLPLTTLAWYLNDPASYNPDEALLRLIRTYPPADRRAIGLLLDLYGSSFWGEQGFPPRPRATNTSEAGRMLGRYRVLQSELKSRPHMAALFEDVRPTLEQDIRELGHQAALAGSENGPMMHGDRFSGGGAEVFERTHQGRWVNYVYARPTGRSEMRAQFKLEAVPAKADLRMVALNDNFGSKPRLSVRINGAVVFQGESPFTSEGFSERRWPVPAGALRNGANEITVTNEEAAGTLGMPPWFMVAEAEIIPVAQSGQAGH